MSINPNIQYPLNIDQKFTQLNTQYQEFNTIGIKLGNSYFQTIFLVSAVSLTCFAAIIYLENALPALYNKKNISNNSYDAPPLDIMTSAPFVAIIWYIGLKFMWFAKDKIDDNFYNDPVIVKYLKHDTPRDHIDQKFGLERKLNRIEFRDLSNLKMVINSEAGKTLPSDVWNEIAGYLAKI